MAKGFVNTLNASDDLMALQVLEAQNNVIGNQGITTKFRDGSSWQRWYLKGYVDLPWNDDGTRIGHIVGHLYNFRHFLGSNDLFTYENHGTASRTKWEFGPWQLLVDSIWETDRSKDAMKTGGFVLTHVLYLERNNKLFGAEKAQNLCFFLELALGFIEGAYVGPSLTTGRREDDPFVWIWPGIDLKSPQDRRQNWAFHHRYTGCMSVLTPMWEAWSGPKEQEWIRRAIPIYLEACRNDLTSDSRVVMAQTGIEMMAALILTEKDRVMTLGQYEGLHTAAQLRALMTHLKIDTSLPTAMKCRPRSARGDIADAVIDMRNAVVHPTTANRRWLANQDTNAWDDGWRVMLEILELAILYGVGYKGQYASYVNGAGFPRVPWV